MEILIAFFSAILAGFFSYLFQLFSKRQKKKKQELSLKIEKFYSQIVDEFSDNYIKDFDRIIEQYKIEDSKSKSYVQEARASYEKSLRNMISHSSIYITEKEIEDNINKKLADIKNRMNQIEDRFPTDSTLDKIASINDAILAKNIETLSESVKNIEKKLLSKWDMAKVVFQILTVLGVLVGIIFTVIELAE